MVHPLEARNLLAACTPSTTEPWCLDDGFAATTERHAVVSLGGDLAQGRATQLQTVDGQQRILIAGSAVDPSAPANPMFAVARLCPDGTLDDGVNCGAGSQNGFGAHGGGLAPGFIIKDFFNMGSPVQPDTERVDAIAIQPQTHSTFCDGPDPASVSDKIVVFGSVLRSVGTVRYLWGGMRLCANGEIDLGFGGQPRDYDAKVGHTSDEPGTVTVGLGDGSGSWTRNAEPFAVAVEPQSHKIVVGGYGAFPPPPNPKIDEFALARLCPDGRFDNGDLGTQAGNCGAEGFGKNDDDPGRIRFDGFKSGGGTYVDNDRTDSRIFGLQLAPTLDPDHPDQFDVLIAGQTRNPSQNQSDFFVARVKHDGDRNFLASSTQWNPLYWRKTIDFGQPSARDDYAFDLAYSTLDQRLVVVGTTCTLGSGANLDADPSQPCDLAFARLGGTDGQLDYAQRVTGGAQQLATTFTDVAYSVVLQAADDNGQGDSNNQGGDGQGDNNSQGDGRFFVVGGYSVDADGGAPYMAGARFAYDQPDPGAYAFFRSDFAGSTGDQARELQVQSDNRIVVGGWHTEGGGADFAAIRLCEDPTAGCDNMSGPSGGGGGGGSAGSDTAAAAGLDVTPTQPPADQPGTPAQTAPASGGLTAPVTETETAAPKVPPAPAGHPQALASTAPVPGPLDSPLDPTTWVLFG
jgi:uncharacterized delta-60 repeat protein